jgi:hypothetical protein
MRSRRGAVLILGIASVLSVGTIVAQTNAHGADKIYGVGDGVTPPVPVRSPEPKYSKQARREKLQVSACFGWSSEPTASRGK